jgi:hypothetical protein
MKKLRQIIKKKDINSSNSGYSPDHDTVVTDGDTDFETVSENIMEGLKQENKISDLSDSLGKHYKKVFDNSSEGEIYAIDSYMHNSRPINNYHWKNDKTNSNYETETRNLDNILNKEKTPHKLVVYSGTRHDPRQVKDKDNIVNHPAYLSTSIKKGKGGEFARRNKVLDLDNNIEHQHLLKIHVPEGHSGVYVAHAGLGMTNEREFLLPRNTKMRYLRTETKIFPNSHRDIHQHIHHMEVLPHDEN